MMSERPVKKRAVNLFVDADLLDEARRLRINMSETLERRLRTHRARGARGRDHASGRGRQRAGVVPVEPGDRPVGPVRHALRHRGVALHLARTVGHMKAGLVLP